MPCPVSLCSVASVQCWLWVRELVRINKKCQSKRRKGWMLMKYQWGKKYHNVGKRNNGLLEQLQCSIFLKVWINPELYGEWILIWPYITRWTESWNIPNKLKTTRFSKSLIPRHFGFNQVQSHCDGSPWFLDCCFEAPTLAWPLSPYWYSEATSAQSWTRGWSWGGYPDWIWRCGSDLSITR